MHRYRDSALTKLLKSSLGGNSNTLMFANVNPCDRNAKETVSTLRYASRAKKIKNKVVKNINPKDAIVLKLQSEIQLLKKLLKEKDSVIETFGQNGPGADECADENNAISTAEPSDGSSGPQTRQNDKKGGENDRSSEAKRDIELLKLRLRTVRLHLYSFSFTFNFSARD